MDESQLRSGGPEAPARATDFDWVGRAGKVVERYKIFYVLLVAAMAWWGRNVVLPLRESAQTTGEVRLINKKIDEVIVPQLTEGRADRSRMMQIQEGQARILGTLARLQCLRTSAIDRVKIDLDCKDIPIEFPKAGGL